MMHYVASGLGLHWLPMTLLRVSRLEWVNQIGYFSNLNRACAQCIFDFETRNKQMFTEARAFSRVTYVFYFLASQLDFFLNLHSETSYPTPFSKTVQRDDTNFGPFLFYSVAK